ncbi:MAG: hypothetical protein R3F39_23230 [Myxococcota bacterium]
MTPDERSFPNPYRAWAKTARNATLAGVAFACVPAAIPQVPTALFAGLGAMAATVGVILWIAFAFTGRGIESELESFRRGEELARWEVSPRQFETWAVERAKQARKLPWVLGGTLALAGVTTISLFAADGAWTEAAIATAITLVVAFGSATILNRITARGLKLPRSGSVPVVIGHRCAVMNGVVYQWRGFGVRLVGATAVEEPAGLQIHYVAEGESGEVDHTLHLPCPPSRWLKPAASQANYAPANPKTRRHRTGQTRTSPPHPSKRRAPCLRASVAKVASPVPPQPSARPPRQVHTSPRPPKCRAPCPPCPPCLRGKIRIPSPPLNRAPAKTPWNHT